MNGRYLVAAAGLKKQQQTNSSIVVSIQFMIIHKFFIKCKHGQGQAQGAIFVQVSREISNALKSYQIEGLQ